MCVWAQRTARYPPGVVGEPSESTSGTRSLPPTLRAADSPQSGVPPASQRTRLHPAWGSGRPNAATGLPSAAHRNDPNVSPTHQADVPYPQAIQRQVGTIGARTVNAVSRLCEAAPAGVELDRVFTDRPQLRECILYIRDAFRRGNLVAMLASEVRRFGMNRLRDKVERPCRRRRERPARLRPTLRVRAGASRSRQDSTSR